MLLILVEVSHAPCHGKQVASCHFHKFKFHCHSSLEKILACICGHQPIIVSLLTYRGQRGRELKRELKSRELTTRELTTRSDADEGCQMFQGPRASNALMTSFIVSHEHHVNI